MMPPEEGAGRGDGAKKRRSVRYWGLQDNRTLLCVKIQFNCHGGECYCQRLQKDKKDGSNV
jgi:hypothetical protein